MRHSLLFVLMTVPWPAAGAERRQPGEPTPAPQVLLADRSLPPSTAELLAELHRENQLVIGIGTRAVRHGTSPDVRRLGDRARRDHALLDRLARGVAEQEGLDLANVPPSTAAATARRNLETGRSLQLCAALDAAQGSRFDREAADAIAALDGETADRLSLALATEDDKRVRGLLSRVIPIMRQDVSLARLVAAEPAGRDR